MEEDEEERWKRGRNEGGEVGGMEEDEEERQRGRDEQPVNTSRQT